VNNIEPSDVPLTVDNDTSTPHVTSTGDHGNITSIERHKVGDLVLLNIELDRVVDANCWVRVSDRSAVVGGDEWDTTSTKSDLANLEELVRSLLGCDAVDGETALNVVQDAEVLPGLFDGDDVLETGGVGGVGTDLSVDLDQTLGNDSSNLTSSQRVLQSVAEEDVKGQTFAKLVRTRGWAGSVSSAQFVEHPGAGRTKALQVLFGSTSHLEGTSRS